MSAIFPQTQNVQQILISLGLLNVGSESCGLLNRVCAVGFMAPREVFWLHREKYLKHSLAETIIHCIFVGAICTGKYSHIGLLLSNNLLFEYSLEYAIKYLIPSVTATELTLQ